MKKVVIIALILLLIATLTYAVGQRLRGNKGSQLAPEECQRFVNEDGDNVNDLCPNEGEMFRKRLRDGTCENEKAFGRGIGQRRGPGNR